MLISMGEEWVYHNVLVLCIEGSAMPDLLALSSWKGTSRAVLFVPYHLFILCLFSLFLVFHREGKFRFELSKLMIVAKTPRDEL